MLDVFLVNTRTVSAGCGYYWSCHPMISHTCSIGDRSGDLSGQGNMPALCRARCVTTAVPNVSRPKTVLLQTLPWSPSDLYAAITGTKTKPASFRKHIRSPSSNEF
ncbi:hypothetical protein TNCV_873221 [Trichonephila clavipes]|nr:hypothetical protein TNCV_873221 [Trichonephila clavipes]